MSYTVSYGILSPHFASYWIQLWVCFYQSWVESRDENVGQKKNLLLFSSTKEMVWNSFVETRIFLYISRDSWKFTMCPLLKSDCCCIQDIITLFCTHFGHRRWNLNIYMDLSIMYVINRSECIISINVCSLKSTYFRTTKQTTPPIISLYLNLVASECKSAMQECCHWICENKQI